MRERKNEKDNCERGRRQMKRNGKEIAEQGSNSFKSSSECFPLFLTTGTRSAAEAARGCPRPRSEVGECLSSKCLQQIISHVNPSQPRLSLPLSSRKRERNFFFFAATFKFLNLWPRSIHAKLP